ncbi:hypothetical protein CDAR_186811 [Caerostris darwini]|uniref:LAGLIDADG homing endonuclease n=1 Tax=Caerostris darwini TaxID=1538125 RepID=A0AAV4PML9_9ARAC|nr:hypothetical protein CDAR_186811 [Caerostris darwini]
MNKRLYFLLVSNPQNLTLSRIYYLHIYKEKKPIQEFSDSGKPGSANLPSLPVQESSFQRGPQVKGFEIPFRVPHVEKELGANSWATCLGQFGDRETLASCLFTRCFLGVNRDGTFAEIK